jgi:hypothetical protein
MTAEQVLRKIMERYEDAERDRDNRELITQCLHSRGEFKELYEWAKAQLEGHPYDL